MSKCDIRITFNRPDRSYRGGETVSGEVHILVNQDIRCNGIVLTHFWKTHGRGNTASGEKHTISLSESVPLQAGEELHFPFEFVAERWPLTYHGHYINVDHYVHVAVDVPWAIDPKHEEDYVVLPGERPPEFDGGRGEIVVFEKKATEVKGIFKVLLIVLLGFLATAFAALAFFVVPILLVGGGIYWVWKKMIASRVGEVDLQVPHVIVGPGEKWPLKLSFTPKKTFPVNGITLRMLGQEAATSGSGTNSTTHTHTLHEETHTLYPAGSLMAGETFSEEFLIDFPVAKAWSIDESDNKVSWTAEVRIDIPRFPDWKKTTSLQVVPPEFLDEVTAPRSGEPVAAIGQGDTAAEPELAWDSATDESADQYTGSGEDMAPLLALVDDIQRAGRFGNERSEIVTAAAGHTYDVVIIPERVASTFGFPGNDMLYESGRTVIGKLANTNQTVQLFAVEASNDALDHLRRGDSFSTLATVENWDSLYDRLVLYEVPFDE